MQPGSLQDLAHAAERATIVFRSDLTVLHANQDALLLFGPDATPVEGRNVHNTFVGPLVCAGEFIAHAVSSGQKSVSEEVAIGVAFCQFVVTRGARYWIVRIRYDPAIITELNRLRE